MQNTDRTVNTFRNSFWGIIARIIVMLCQFGFRAFIIREIGWEYIGLNGLFRSILTVLNMSELGFASAIIYLMYKPVAENDIKEIRALLNEMRKLYRIVGLVILVVGCSIMPFFRFLVKNDTGKEVNLYILYLMYLFNSSFSYLSSAYRSTLFSAYQRSDILSKIALFMEVILYSTQAVVLYVTRNYYLYLLVFALAVIPHNFLFYVVSRKMYPDIYCEGEITQEQKDSIRSKVLPLLVHRIGGTVIISIDDMIISAFLGVTYLTTHDNYYYILSNITILLGILRGAVVASLGNKMYTSSLDDLYSTYKKVFFVWVTAVGWCACFLIGLYQPFIQFWVGSDFLYSDRIMLLLSAYFFVWQFRLIGVTMKEAAGLWEPDKWKPVIGMAFNLVVSILMVIVTKSVVGVLFPTMVVMLFIYFPWETYVLFRLVFKRDCRDYLQLTAKCVLASVISMILIYLTTSRIPYDSFGLFLLRMFMCVMIPGAIFLAFHFKSEQLKSLVADIRRVVFRRS